MTTETEKLLRDTIFTKLVDFPAYYFKHIPPDKLQSLVYDCSKQSRHREWRIFYFAYKQFYKKHRHKYTLVFILASLLISIASKIIANKLTIIGTFALLIFSIFYPFHAVKFLNWYSDTHHTSSLLVSKLITINKKVIGFNSKKKKNLERMADKIFRQLIQDEIKFLDYQRAQKGKITFKVFLFASFSSWAYAYIIGDSLNSYIVRIAEYMGFGDFSQIKALTTETIVLSVFSVSAIFMAHKIESYIEKRRSMLEDIIVEIDKKSNQQSNLLKKSLDQISDWFSKRKF